MKNVKLYLPNVITLINLSLGILAILISVTDDIKMTNLVQASFLIMLAALTDRLDGKLARAFDASSDLGKELDSLSDLISFGVAPVIIAWKIHFIQMDLIGYLIVLVFPIAGAYRLARYNVTEFDDFFRGLPITLAGAFLSIYNLYVLYFRGFKEYAMYPIISSVIVIFLSFSMISQIRLKKR